MLKNPQTQLIQKRESKFNKPVIFPMKKILCNIWSGITLSNKQKLQQNVATIIKFSVNIAPMSVEN